MTPVLQLGGPVDLDIRYPALCDVGALRAEDRL